MKLKIDEMFAFVAENPDGEGVMGIRQDGAWLPLVGADMARIASLKPMVEKIARESGVLVKLVKFSVRTELETINSQ